MDETRKFDENVNNKISNKHKVIYKLRNTKAIEVLSQIC